MFRGSVAKTNVNRNYMKQITEKLEYLTLNYSELTESL